MDVRNEIGYILWDGEKPNSVGASLLKDKVTKLEDLFKQWALEMNQNIPHRGSCALYQGEQTNECNCGTAETQIYLDAKIEELAK